VVKIEDDDRKLKEQSISRAASLMGRKGGLKTAQTHDAEFYVKIGKKGAEKREENKRMNQDLKERFEKTKKNIKKIVEE
jgi:general stress protein YciG